MVKSDAYVPFFLNLIGWFTRFKSTWDSYLILTVALRFILVFPYCCVFLLLFDLLFRNKFGWESNFSLLSDNECRPTSVCSTSGWRRPTAPWNPSNCRPTVWRSSSSAASGRYVRWRNVSISAGWHGPSALPSSAVLVAQHDFFTLASPRALGSTWFSGGLQLLNNSPF